MQSTPKQLFKELDANFEKFLNDILIDVKETELTPDKKAQRRAKAKKSDLDFAKIYYPKIFTLPFNAAHKHIAKLKKGNHTVSGFPMSGKTAFTFIAKAIKPLAFGNAGLVNITLRTQDVARERTYQIYRLIAYNRLIMYDYNVEFQQEQKGFYIINNSILVATSVETGLRNFVDDEFKRFRVAIWDDCYNRISASSTNDNKKTTEFITGELYRQMEPDGLCIGLGNRINDDVPIVKIAKMFPDNHFSFPVKDKNGRSNWMAKYKSKDLVELQRKTPYDVWQGEWLDEPQTLGDVFKDSWLRGININLVQVLATITAADPAHGESPQSCFKSLATLSATSSHEVVLEDIYIRHEDYFKFFDYVDVLRSRFPRWKVLLFENDFGQWGFAKPYYEIWMEKHKGTIAIVLHLSKDSKTEFRAADKDSRIMNLVMPHQTGQFRYSELIMNGGDWELYKSQYLSFGSHGTKKLDGLDATATAYIKIFAYIETGGFKALANRTWEKVRMFR